MDTTETKLDFARRQLEKSEENLAQFPNWRVGQFYQSRVEVYAEMVRDLETEKGKQFNLIISAKVMLAELSSKYTIAKEIGDDEEISKARTEYEACHDMYSDMVRKYRDEWGNKQASKDFAKGTTTTDLA